MAPAPSPGRGAVGSATHIHEESSVTDDILFRAGPVPVSRRNLLIGAGVVAVAVVGAAAWRMSTAASSQPRAGKKGRTAAVSEEELMRPGPLPDLVLGSADAPITVVEYASMTCGHCARFHNTVFPTLKSKYVDTGKVRFILREFPLDSLAAAASMVARCAGGDKTFPLVSALFARQEEWAFVQSDQKQALFKFARQAGFTEDSFNKCIGDKKLLDDITAIRAHASETLGVTSTPTFFINGKKMTSAPTVEEFEKAFAPLLKT